MSNHILIYGYGREGQSTERFLHQHCYPEVISIYDAKTHPIDLQWDAYDQIWISPGIPPDQIPLVHHTKITSQADFFFANLTADQRKKVIAITGSKGKTTTTTALTHCLQQLGHRAASAGNIGLPLLEALPQLQHDQLDFLVTEISSFQAESLQHSPHTVIFLNLFPDHLDRHGNETDYLAAKQNLWAHQADQDFLILPQLTQKLMPQLETQTQSVITTKSLSPETYPLKSILDADHFRENLGTIPVALKNLGIKFTQAKLRKSLQSIPLPAHRLERVGEIEGVQFYNDAIASNPTAAIAAVKYFGSNLGVLILGGKSSEGDPSELLQTIEKIVPDAKIMITSSNFAEEIKAIKTSLDITEYPDLPAIFETLPKLPAGKVVLLSPAAKSFDQYPGYPAKGDHFKALVDRLKKFCQNSNN